MRYADGAAFRMALESRLNAQARDGRSVDRLRKLVAFERFLARLSVSTPDSWVVKGGLALEFRYGDRARATRDLDVATLPNSQAIEETLIQAALLDLGDFFEFDLTSTRLMNIEDTPGIHRFSILCLLARRRFETLTIDVGVNHLSSDQFQMIGVSDLLDFAGIEPVVVPALPLEIHIAEKLHAYTREYGDGRLNTRVKDLIDIVLIASLSSFELGALRDAIQETFGSRQIQVVPAAFPKPGEHWRVPYAQLAREVGLPEDLNDGFRAAGDFLDPVLSTEPLVSAQWEPTQQTWS
jgi:hypothetical protein